MRFCFASAVAFFAFFLLAHRTPHVQPVLAKCHSRRVLHDGGSRRNIKKLWVVDAEQRCWCRRNHRDGWVHGAIQERGVVCASVSVSVYLFSVWCAASVTQYGMAWCGVSSPVLCFGPGACFGIPQEKGPWGAYHIYFSILTCRWPSKHCQSVSQSKISLCTHSYVCSVVD